MSLRKDNHKKKDNFYMNLALKLARDRVGLTGINPSVGCVIVKDKKIISYGVTSLNGRPHAEFNALNKKLNFANSNIYITLEPCSHYGKTPPCTNIIKKKGLKKRTIAIVNKTNYNLLQDSLNIDDLVDPRMTTVSRIMEHVHRGTIGTVYSLLDGEYEFIEARILEKSELLNKKIRDSNLPEDIRIGAILRKDQVIIPRSNFIFEKDDLVVFLAKREQLKAVENIFSVGSI